MFWGLQLPATSTMPSTLPVYRYPMQYHQQRHRAGTNRSHISNSCTGAVVQVLTSEHLLPCQCLNRPLPSSKSSHFQNETKFKLFLFIESFRFWDENEIFSVLSTARAWTNVILAGESDDRRDSTTSFDENVVVAETSYQIIEVSSSFCDRERAKPSPIKITALIFLVKNSKMKLSRLNVFREYAKKL